MISVNLSNQVAVVTGASRGIGKAITLSLAEQGAKVIAASRTRDDLCKVVDEIKHRGGEAVFVETDISKEDAILNLFNFVDKSFSKLDILINNAGLGKYGRIQDFSADDLDAVLSVNARGTYLCCREAIRRMIPHRKGTIINISSVVGFKGYVNQSAYTASKHAVVGLTKSLAAEVQEFNIRVSVIHPGGVDTKLAQSARPDLDRSILMKPNDIAHAVSFLLSLSDRCAIDEIYIRRRTSKPF
ncbi:MAG TPA: SDR family oxidoreductase [Anaerolineae bacterium]|nr:SDR family oxidoreductase [Anaerolineae bacterium]